MASSGFDMGAPIRFYFDFASPYAWFSLGRIEELAAAHGRSLEWRPVILWAVLKAQGIVPLMESSTRKAYMLADMRRSARYYQVPYTEPAHMPISSHLAARIFYSIAENDLPAAKDFVWSVFEAYFVTGRDISDPAVVAELAACLGVAGDVIQSGMQSEEAKERLSDIVGQAAQDGVCGSPFFIVDGESFFGADRLSQLEWRLTSLVAKGA